MPSGVSRIVKNTQIITDYIKECIELAKSLPNVSDDDKKRFDMESTKDYVNLEFLKFMKNFWNMHSGSGNEKIYHPKATSNFTKIFEIAKKIYINDLLAHNELYLPKLEKPPTNPEYEARLRKLKMQLDEEDYQRMVANVDLNSRYGKPGKEKLALFPEFKTLQGQLVAIINIVATVGGAFVFGYKAVEYSLDQPDITKQMLAGLLLAIIVAIADIYFLFKKLLNLESNENKKSKNS